MSDMENKIVCSDSLEFMKTQEEYSADIIYCDPPYGLGSEVIIRPDGKPDYEKASDFMSKWDMPTGDYWDKWFKESYRALKHGGYCLMFGMDRQVLLFKYYAHLAGFSEHQSLYWYFISNFPKASDLSKNIDKQKKGIDRIVEFSSYIKQKRESLDISQVDADRYICNGSTMYSFFEGRKDKVLYFPNNDHYKKMKEMFKMDDTWDKLVLETNEKIIAEKDGDFGFQKGGERWEDTQKITIPSTPLAKKYEGYKYSITPLKQTNETIMVFQKPYKTGSCLHDTLAMENGDKECACGALDIDGNRVPSDEPISVHNAPKGTFAGGDPDRGSDTSSYREHDGRYPAQTFIDSGVADVIDEQSGIKKSGSMKANHNVGSHGEDGNLVNYGIYGKFKAKPYPKEVEASEGGASKILHRCDYEQIDHDLYFYCPKVNTGERNDGLDGFQENIPMYEQYHRKNAQTTKGIETPYAGAGRGGGDLRNNHPTLKPIMLNKRILKLFKTPNSQRILFPFSGSGSEIIGGIRAGFKDWGACEISQEYVDIANARIKEAEGYNDKQGSLFNMVDDSLEPIVQENLQGDLFKGEEC